jgi:hypothetical protein
VKVFFIFLFLLLKNITIAPSGRDWQLQYEAPQRTHNSSSNNNNNNNNNKKAGGYVSVVNINGCLSFNSRSKCPTVFPTLMVTVLLPWRDTIICSLQKMCLKKKPNTSFHTQEEILMNFTW